MAGGSGKLLGITELAEEQRERCSATRTGFSRAFHSSEPAHFVESMRRQAPVFQSLEEVNESMAEEVQLVCLK